MKKIINLKCHKTIYYYYQVIYFLSPFEEVMWRVTHQLWAELLFESLFVSGQNWRILQTTDSLRDQHVEAVLHGEHQQRPGSRDREMMRCSPTEGSTADWLYHRCLLLTLVLVCPQRRQPAPSSSQSKQKTIKITTLNNMKTYKRRKGESAALPLPACSAPH